MGNRLLFKAPPDLHSEKEQAGRHESGQPLKQDALPNTEGDQTVSSARTAGSRETDTRAARPVVAATGAFRLTLRNTDTGLADARYDGAIGVREVAGGPVTIFTRIDHAVTARGNIHDVLAGRAAGRGVGGFALFAGFDDPVSALGRIGGALALGI